MYKLCAFDLDGTLVNTLADIADAINLCLIQLGCPTHTEAALTQMIGDGVRKICARALPADKQHLTDELVQLYGDRYFEHCLNRSEAYAGMPALVARLHNDGIKLAVASNKPDPQTQRVVAHYFEGVPFAAVYGQRAEIPRKPAPDMLHRVLLDCGVSPDDAIYVGDSNVDVQFAHAAGVRCIGVSWGFRGAQELIEAGADYIVHTADEIYDIVRG